MRSGCVGYSNVMPFRTIAELLTFLSTANIPCSGLVSTRLICLAC